MDNYRFIVLSIKDSIATIKINRPEERNRLNRDTMIELISCLNAINNDANINVVIITGEGEYFCGGGQIDSFPGGYVVNQREYATAFIEMHQTIYKMNKPVIAAIQGHAIAGGMSLVEACDLAVAGRECKFGLPEINAGLFPMLALAVMGKCLPKKRVFELALTGKLVDAETVESWDLVNAVVEQDKVLETAISWGSQISKKSSVAIDFGREAYYNMADMDLASAFEYGKTSLLGLLWTEDAQESGIAIKEGRQPVFKGR